MTTLVDDVRAMVAEQVQYRELLWQMVRRDLLLRYKQTAMGFAWAVFMPLLNTVVFSNILARVAPFETPVPYPVFVYCGLLVWNFFAASLRFSMTSLTSNTNLVTKIYFPREIFPFSAMLVCLIDAAVGATILVGLMVYYGITVGPALLFLPVVIAVHVAFTAALALLLSMANLFLRDVKYLLDVALTVWMFLTSVLYPPSLIGGKAQLLVALNPMTAIVDAYRAVILLRQLPDMATFGPLALVSFLLLLVNWRQFHRTELRFAEMI